MKNNKKNVQMAGHGMGTRLVCLWLACFMLAGVCGQAALADAFPQKGACGRAEKGRTFGGSREAMERLLGLFALRAPKSEGARVGDWFLHPKGFAFLIPEGFEPLVGYKGTAVLLVDESEGEGPFRTNISVSVSGEADERDKIFSMSPKDVENAYEGSFDRFELLAFEPETFYGSEGMRITFLAGSSPRLLFRQHLFVKNESAFVITLTTEHAPRALKEADRQFQWVCDSLLFVPGGGLRRQGK